VVSGFVKKHDNIVCFKPFESVSPIFFVIWCKLYLFTNPNEMTKAWSNMTVKQYKALKNLKKENLRDNMTNIELVLNMLAEVTSTAISKNEKPDSFDSNKQVARRGGRVARNARKNIETEIGKTVISPVNAKNKANLEISILKSVEQK
jgi:hypothetical protein